MCDLMKRCLLVGVCVILPLLIAGIGFTIHPALAQSATQLATPQSSQPASAGPTLECQGCHAPGKPLPYLAGAKFHANIHTAYDHGFHAQAIQNGSKAATCLNCHTRNGDLSTVLPASDTRSTINRSNIAETCGRCHGDKSIMQGSGISNRPFLLIEKVSMLRLWPREIAVPPCVRIVITVMTSCLPPIPNRRLQN